MHRDPARSWTVESLAAEARMSRSAFAVRFKELVGESPLHYVTRWRMLVAMKWLQEEDAPLGNLAGSHPLDVIAVSDLVRQAEKDVERRRRERASRLIVALIHWHPSTGVRVADVVSTVDYRQMIIDHRS